MFISPNIEVKKSSICSGKGVFAKELIKKGALLIHVEAKIVTSSSVYALQTGEHRYLLAPYADNYINHSCHPNVLIKLYPNKPRYVSFIAIKKIDKSQELFWNFNTTEWDLKDRFKCGCNSKDCVGQIRGMKYLTSSQEDPALCYCLHKEKIKRK